MAAITVGAASLSRDSRGAPGGRRGFSVDPADFGAHYDGSTDDTAALQRAVDACASGGRWQDLVISGPLLVRGPIMIDRMVDKSSGIFRVLKSSGGRIVHDGEGPLFDSRIPVTKYPMSEYVRLEGLAIESRGCLFSRAFLRIQISNCFIQKARIIETDLYVQSLEISETRFVGAADKPLIVTREAYDITISRCHFERAGRVLKAEQVNGIMISGCVIETCKTPVIDIDGVNGLSFIGNYTEGNGGETIILGARQGKSQGVAIFGNNLKGVFPNKTGCEIVLGRAHGVASGGNYCSGDLYDTGYVSVGGLQSLADVSKGRLTTNDYPVRLAAPGTVPAPADLDLGAALSVIPSLSSPVSIVRGVREGAAVSLPVSVGEDFRRQLTVINEGPAALLVRSTPGSHLLGAKSTGLIVPPSEARTFLEYTAGRWCTT